MWQIFCRCILYVFNINFGMYYVELHHFRTQLLLIWCWRYALIERPSHLVMKLLISYHSQTNNNFVVHATLVQRDDKLKYPSHCHALRISYRLSRLLTRMWLQECEHRVNVKARKHSNENTKSFLTWEKIIQTNGQRQSVFLEMIICHFSRWWKRIR